MTASLARTSAIVRALGTALVLTVLATACSKSGAKPGDSTGTSSDDGSSAQAAADTSPQSQLALPVTADAAREGDLVLRVNTTGQIRSDAAVKLKAEVAGTVAQVLVRPGTRVTKGQVLIRLDPYPFDLAVREAQASTDQAEQAYLELYLPDSLVTGRSPSTAQRNALMNKTGLPGARLKLERAKWEQSRATVTSPVDGMIDGIDIAAGERVSGGTQLLTAVDTRNLRIEAQVL